MKDSELEQLFEAEEKIQQAIREISTLLLDLSDFTLAKSVLELAKVQVLGKRIRDVCDRISDDIHQARKKLGDLMVHHTHVKFKDADKALHDMEKELSLAHGSLETIGHVAETFYESKNRRAAFDNLNKAFSSLIHNITSLLVDASRVKELKI